MVAKEKEEMKKARQAAIILRENNCLPINNSNTSTSS